MDFFQDGGDRVGAILDRISRRGVWPTHGNDIKVIDGGFATQLVKLGHEYIDSDPLWGSKTLVNDPDAVKQVHTSFLEAGADIILTNTYHINVNLLVKHLNVSETVAINIIKTGVRIAREARDEFVKSGKCDSSKRPLVAGSVGAYAINFQNAAEYHGNYADDIDVEGIKTWHRPRLSALIEEGVDLVAFETMPTLKDAQAVCQVIKEFPGTQAWMTFTLKDESHIAHGEALSDCLKLAMDNDQIVGIGVNCCPPGLVEGALKVLAPARGKKALIVYPNSGETWTRELRWTGKAEAAPLSSYIPGWLELGATWIGGCGRVYDTDIAEMCRTMRTASSRGMMTD